jgi:hypothetical protein
MFVQSPLYLIVLYVFLLVLSVITALLEIQIEGPDGWAKKLPTWRITKVWYKVIFNRTEITGYHVYLGIFMLLMFHFPLVVLGWSWFAEWTVLSLYSAFNIVWDFLWFVLNPAFGWHGYTQDKIWWFQRWRGPFPSDYYGSIAISGLFAMLRGDSAAASSFGAFGTIPQPLQHLIGWAIGMIVCILGCTLLIYTRSKEVNDAGKVEIRPIRIGKSKKGVSLVRIQKKMQKKHQL